MKMFLLFTIRFLYTGLQPLRIRCFTFSLSAEVFFFQISNSKVNGLTLTFMLTEILALQPRHLSIHKLVHVHTCIMFLRPFHSNLK